MKVSSGILLVTSVLMIIAMFVSNILLKKEYDAKDKNDIYWTYDKILEQPFKHLKIIGGNVTNIAYEQSKSSSVRVSKNWRYDDKALKASVKNDTLFVEFPNTYKNIYEKQFMSWSTLVRIFSPELLSVDGFDTNFEMLRLKQKNLKINLAGKSKLEVESYLYDFDSLQISEKDSSVVVFEMSPDLKSSNPVVHKGMQVTPVSLGSSPTDVDIQKLFPAQDQSAGWETIYIKAVNANVQGASILDLGHAQINSLKLNISDTSAIILSGGSLGRFKK